MFLSRPRRFGKSLLDTLHNLFEGKQNLFADLAAEHTHDWSKTHPVIHIEFTEGNFRNEESLRLSIINAINENEKRLGVSAESPEPAIRFPQLIRETAKKYNANVVILIDEYDKPILDNMDQPEMAILAREELKALYSAIKGNDAHIRFAFLTGVTKFSRVSVFSGINNVVDISLKPEFGTICGYTQNDLETLFAEYLQGANMDEVKLWYNGYHFMGEQVYNPFDILLFLDNDTLFKSYWFETGTPTFLVKLLRQHRFFLPDLSKITAGEELLTSFDIDNISPVPLLFQSGYLTIKEVRRRGSFVSYTLGFPNLEVSAAFTNSLLDLFTETFLRNDIQRDLYFSLEDGNLEQFKSAIHALFASIPYQNYTNNDIAQYEGFYASVIFAWLSSAHLRITMEDSTNQGRIDMSVEMENTIYLIEFKVDIPQQKALEQIKTKGYSEKYQTKGKKIVLIGIDFSSEEKNMVGFAWEEA